MKKRFRLKDDHPLHKKLKKVFDAMDKQGIMIDVQRDGTFLVMEKNKEDRDGLMYELVDLESGGVGCLPPVFEYKICFERDVKDE